MHVTDHEQVHRAVAAIFVIDARDLAGRSRDGLAHLANELKRALVQADHRARRIGRLGVEIEHVLHTGDVLAVDLRHAPHLLTPRLELVLGQAPAHGLRERSVDELRRPRKAPPRDHPMTLGPKSKSVLIERKWGAPIVRSPRKLTLRAPATTLRTGAELIVAGAYGHARYVNGDIALINGRTTAGAVYAPLMGRLWFGGTETRKKP